MITSSPLSSLVTSILAILPALWPLIFFVICYLIFIKKDKPRWLKISFWPWFISVIISFLLIIIFGPALFSDLANVMGLCKGFGCLSGVWIITILFTGFVFVISLIIGLIVQKVKKK